MKHEEIGPRAPDKQILALLKPLLSKKYAETKAGKKAADKERELKHAIR